MTRPILVRPQKVMTMLDVSKSKVYALVREGLLKAHNAHPGRKGLRIYLSSVEEYAFNHGLSSDYWRE